jgi:hypothetical protein
MAISDTQKVDYLWKKIGYAATKTDTTANKDATNEALPSPLQIRGDTLLVQSSSIPSSIPATTTSIVTVYRPDATLEMPQTAIGTNGPGQRGQLGSATAYRTWQTGTQNWISPEFGATYSVRVFLDDAGRTTSNTTGTELFATASGEEWFFDYQSGVLNFSGTSLPSGISTKSVYISGARYTGEIGIANTVNTAAAAFAHANAAFAAANTGASSAAAFNQANSAFFHANAAFTAANNATDTYVRNHANAAFDAANAATATDTTQNNSITAASNKANAAFIAANSNYTSAVTKLSVTNSGASAYLLDQYSGNNPTIYVRAGETIAFDLNVSGHPFMIRLSSGGANYDTGLIHVATDGTVSTTSSAQGKVSGTLYWKVPFDIVGSTYVYQCSAHGGMVGNIVIEQPTIVALNTANAAFNHANAAFIAANAATATDTTQNNSISAAFIRANNSLDANNGGTISGDIIITGNLSCNIVGGTF